LVMTKVTNTKRQVRYSTEEAQEDDLRYKCTADETAFEYNGAKRGTDNDCRVCS
jgi:hypothetical protein